jgi:membrane protein YqaA with SNARE-associated domain
MLQGLSQRLGIPPAGVVALGVLSLVQLALQVYALVDLVRRVRVAGGRKWPWLLIIVLGQLLGAIIYLALGRKADEVVDAASAGGSRHERMQQALDTLYDRKDPR